MTRPWKDKPFEDIMAFVAQGVINISEGLTGIEPSSAIHRAMEELCYRVTEGVVGELLLQAPLGDKARPDFSGFAKALRDEAEWVARIHRGDKTGQARADMASLGGWLVW